MCPPPQEKSPTTNETQAKTPQPPKPPKPEESPVKPTTLDDGGTSKKVHSCLPAQEKSPKPEKSMKKETPPRNQATPKRKRTLDSPPGTPTPKTPRLQISAKIRQKLEPKHPPVPTQAKKIHHPKKKNPHPHHNQQEFVKVGQNVFLLKHRGLATSSRTKSLKPKKIDPHPQKQT